MIFKIAPRAPTLLEREKWESWMLRARVLRPYYARALSLCTVVAADGLNTMGIDKNWTIYADFEACEKWGDEIVAGTIATHEVEHILRNHEERCKCIAADPNMWNQAGDAEINDDGAIVPDFAVTPAKLNQPDGLLAEEYYRSMDAITETITCGGGSGTGNPKDYEISSDKRSSFGLPKGLSPEEGEIIRDQVAADVREYVKTHKPGSVPDSTVLWAESRKKVVVLDWRALLAAHIRRGCLALRGAYDYCYRRPHRRQQDNMPLRPSLIGRQPKIVILVDTSGSVADADTGAKILSVVHGICRRTSLTEIITCDTEVKSRGRKAKYVGGGGTDLRVGLAAACGDLIVVLTDGDTPWPTEAPRNSQIVVVLVDGTREVPHYARSVVVPKN